MLKFFGKMKEEDLTAEKATKLWRQGKLNSFPTHLFSRAEWPAPLWVLVEHPEDLVGLCPNCGSSQQAGPRIPFPATYFCGCGFRGRHPLAGLSSSDTEEWKKMVAQYRATH